MTKLTTCMLTGMLAIILFSSCRKEQLLDTGGELQFSVDTLMFDTVFTGRGNFTTSVKIYNPQSQRVKVSSIRLKKDPGTYFTLNVDGTAGNVVKDIEIAANDSIYVFATVNIDPNDEDIPFIVEDDLIATLNGKDYSIPFVAYGQNAHYVIDSVINTNQTWLTDRPYVIMRNALVEEGITLTIPAGCRVYVHGDSRLFVSGTLKVNGTKQDSVVFQGDRLDRKYFGDEGYPGEWGGIYFTSSSHNNEIHYAVLKNCGGETRLGEAFLQPAAIQVNEDTLGGQLQLFMTNTIIENSIGFGILSFSGSIVAENCLINTCGAQCFAATQGGFYVMKNCTFVTYGTDKVSHTDNAVMALLNYFEFNNQFVTGPLDCKLINCVIWGSLENELIASKIDGAQYDVSLENCLIKVKDGLPTGDTVTAVNCKLNEDPNFTSVSEWNYRPMAGSPLIDAGKKPPFSSPLLTPPVTDLDGKARNVNATDIGCYEY